MRKEEGVPNGTHESVPNGIGEEGSMRKEEGVTNNEIKSARLCNNLTLTTI